MNSLVFTRNKSDVTRNKPLIRGVSMASLLEEMKKSEISHPQKCADEKFLSQHTQHWQPRGSSTWLCEICSPPPKPIMVSKRRDTSQKFIEHEKQEEIFTRHPPSIV